jgi:hypothetical protein
MKAERRHELKSNTLARALESLPDLGRKYGGKALLLVVLILLLIVFIRTRISAGRRQEQLAWQNLTAAWQSIQALRQPRVIDPVGLAVERKITVAEALQALSSAREDSDDPQVLAQVLLAQGELYYLLGTLPPSPAATTRPAELGTEPPPVEALKLAGDAYRRVIEDYPAQTLLVANARMGLAAIAENAHDWDAAREMYQTVLRTPGLTASHKALADAHLLLLDKIRKPVLVAQPASRPIDLFGSATERSDVLGAAPFISTQPATQPEQPPDPPERDADNASTHPAALRQ